MCIFARVIIKTTAMKTKNEILHLLTLYKPTAESKYGLTRIGIFGSVARGEQTEDSDVDVCYEGRVPTLLTLDLIQTACSESASGRRQSMFDRETHYYFEVDTDVVFRTVQEDVPQMKEVIDRMIAEVEKMG